MSKTPFLDAFEQWAKEYEMEEDYIKDVYLTKCDGCIPSQYLGDDINRDIRGKFARPLNFIIEKVQKELGVKRNGLWLYPLIDADYEDATHAAIIMLNHNTGRRDFLYYNSEKAWHYWFQTREDFEKELFDIYVEVHKNLTRLGVGS
jgi:hypothetical protein